MNTVRTRNLALGLLACVLFLGGCFYNPWGPPPIVPDPENLIVNGDAENSGIRWHFSSADATIRFEGGNPTFAVRNDASIRQVVDIRGIPGNYAVLMAVTAAETIGPTGVGMIHGTFLDVSHPQLIVGHLAGNALISAPPIPLITVILTDYFAIPAGTDEIEVFLENTEVAGVPHDGALTWFDDVELWIVETEQDAIDVIHAYETARQP